MSDKQLCSHCRFPLSYNTRGLRHYGFHTAHQESECLRLLQSAIDAQAAEVARQQRIIDGYSRIYNDAMTALRDVVSERDRLQREKTTDALMIERLAEPAQETAATWNALQRSLAEIERLRSLANDTHDEMEGYREECARLRAALREICNEAEVFGGGFAGWIQDKCVDAIGADRAALTPQQPAPSA